MPSPPLAPTTKRRSAPPTAMTSNKRSAVGPSWRSAAAAARSRVSGTTQSRSAATSARSAYPPSLPVWPATRRPNQALSTSDPTRDTRPETALPGTYGGRIDQ